MVQIDKLLGNRKLLKLLLFLATQSSKELSYTELRKKTGLAKATLTKWLSYLEKENLIFMRRIGRNKLYTLNTGNFLVRQLKIFFTLVSLRFMADLSKKHGFEAYLFGSSARGEDVLESDVDILILGDIHKENIIAPISQEAKKLKKNIKLQIFTRGEWVRMRDKDRAFYERVEKDKILLQ